MTGQYPLTRISDRLYCCLCECPTLGPTCAGLCVSGLGLHYTKCILWQGQSRGQCRLHTFTYTCPSGTLSLSWSKAFRLCWDFSGLHPHGVAVRSGSPSALVPLLEEHQLSRNTAGLWALPAFWKHMCGSVSNTTQFFLSCCCLVFRDSHLNFSHSILYVFTCLFHMFDYAFESCLHLETCEYTQFTERLISVWEMATVLLCKHLWATLLRGSHLCNFLPKHHSLFASLEQICNVNSLAVAAECLLSCVSY